MDALSKPYRECYLLSDPKNVYGLTGWDPANRVYELKNDHGQVVKVKYYEFILLSSANEELIEAGDDGKLYTVQQLIDSEGKLKWKRPEWAENEESICAFTFEGAPSEAGRPGAHIAARESKGSQAKALAEAADGQGAKERVRSLLAGCKTREEVAGVGFIYLGEDPGELLNKYMHLDNGRFRMTIGNRMVGLYKKNGGF